MQTLTIKFSGLTARAYEVAVGPGLLTGLGGRIVALNAQPPRRAFVVADEHLPRAMVHTAVGSLTAVGFTVETAFIRAVEADKSLDVFARLMARLAETKHERRDPIIALGGGIVGDLAGFVGASYRRGVPVVQCPTTLLSMVDASVGGKTGVNLEVEGVLKKNMVGAFWQPSLVLADTDTLGSLPDRHLRSGLAECLKHGMISHATDANLLDWTLDHLDDVLARREEALTELVARNVRVKASFVVDDEREEKPSHEGGRALLNLGHTFAHAIETLPGISAANQAESGPLHHGEAVGLGLVAAAYTATAMNRVAWADAERVRRVVEAAGLPTIVRGLPNEEAVLSLMMHDKKVAGGRLRLVLPAALNRAGVVDDPPFEAVRIGLTAIRG